MMFALETVRVDMHEPLEFLLVERVYFHYHKRGACHVLFHAKGFCDTFHERGLPCAQIARERDDRCHICTRHEAAREARGLIIHSISPLHVHGSRVQ